MKKNTSVFYIGTLLLFGAAIWFVLTQGKSLESVKIETAVVMDVDSPSSPNIHFFSNLEKNARHPLAILIIQIFCIMITARVFGYVMTKIGQPSVVGEIMAGIALGPSLLGLVLPEFSGFLFPLDSFKRLHVLSQVGLVLFMFIIGMELDMSVLKKKAQAAVIVSHASIVFPYFLGVGLSYFLFPSFAPEGIPFSAFALFMGIAMSITAFPVLARIVQERGMTQQPIGTLVITCAAADDITAWCLLALVVAIVSAGGMMSAVGSIVLSVVYVVFMWFVVKPLLHRIAVKYDTAESVSKTVVAAVFSILLMSSYLTEVIGIHALFGAFLAGVIMPAQQEFKRIMSEKIEDVSLVMLLPLFFVFTGLRTEIGLLNQANLWSVCFVIIGVAVFGKFVGSALAAKWVGQSWKDSLLIGTLMNTRGLMELVVLNIGYDLGVLSAEIFTMMVLMALVTTFMTGPAISAIEFAFSSKAKEKQHPLEDGFRAMVAFGSPQSGSRLLELAYDLNFKGDKKSSLTAAHFSPSSDISMLEAEQYERESFVPITYMAERLGISLQRIFRVTDHVNKEMIETVRSNTYDIVLVGSSRELFKDNKTGGMVGAIIHESGSAVGVFIDKNFKRIDTAYFILHSSQDLFLLKYAKRFLNNGGIKKVIIFDEGDVLASHQDVLSDMPAGSFIVVKNPISEKDAFKREHEIVFISFNFWESFRRRQGAWLNRMPSVLIINR